MNFGENLQNIRKKNHMSQEDLAELLGVSADEVISGGYRVHTGLDPVMQQAAEALFAAQHIALAVFSRRGVKAADPPDENAFRHGASCERAPRAARLG